MELKEFKELHGNVCYYNPNYFEVVAEGANKYLWYKGNATMCIPQPLNITTCRKMFLGREDLERLDLSDWNVKNIKDFSCMFSNCYNLFDLDLINWNVGSGIKFDFMFKKCKNLKYIRLKGWNPKKAENLWGMFYECKSVRRLDLSDWDVRNVTTIGEMFCGCESLRDLDLSGWQLKYNCETDWVLQDCFKLFEKFNLGEQELSEMLSTNRWPYDGINSVTIRLHIEKDIELFGEEINKWSDGEIKLFEKFSGLKTLKEESTGNLVIYNPDYFEVETDINYTDEGLYLHYYGDDTFKIPQPFNCTCYHNMFAECKCKELDLSDWNMGNAIDLSQMFYKSEIKSIKTTGFTVPSMTGFSSTGWSLPNAKYFDRMFSNNLNIEELDISTWIPTKGVDFRLMFAGCQNLKKLGPPKFPNNNKMEVGGILEDCYSLQEYLKENLSKLTVLLVKNQFPGTGVMYSF